jgi:hypothetical protein
MLFLLYFFLDSKGALFYLSHGGWGNKGHHVYAAHQISADINLWPGIWIVWCDITKWLESWALPLKVCTGCQRRITRTWWPCWSSFHMSYYPGFCHSLPVNKHFQRQDWGNLFFRNIQVCDTLFFPFLPKSISLNDYTTCWPQMVAVKDVDWMESKSKNFNDFLSEIPLLLK